MSKKAKKSVMEEELEAISQGRTCTKEEEGARIIEIIKKHAGNIGRTKMQYLDDANAEQYAMYANIESAFDILIDDIRKEGFAI